MRVRDSRSRVAAFVAVALLVGTLAPAIGAIALQSLAASAGAAPVSPPGNVHFYPPGSDCANATACVNGTDFVSTTNSGKADPFTLASSTAGYQVCGLGSPPNTRVGTNAAAGMSVIDAKLDDPQHFNSTFLPSRVHPDQTVQQRTKGSEGNYANAEVFTFQPQSASLAAGDTINLTLPRPSGTAGSVLPPPSTSLAQIGASTVQTQSTVTYGNAVFPITISSPVGSLNPPYSVVTVELPDATHDGDQIQLASYDAGNPPPLGKTVGVSIWGFRYAAGFQSWSAVGNGSMTAKVIEVGTRHVATFYVTSGARTAIFNATDATTGIAIGRTLSLTFGAPTAPVGPCASVPTAPSIDPEVGYNYLLVDEGHPNAVASNIPPAIIASSVAVRYSSAHESAAITVPAGFAAPAGDTVKIIVLGATSPLACCMTSGASGYAPSDFSIWTSRDVVPASPSTDAALDYVSAFLPMDPSQSTITPATSTAQVGGAATATATVRDQYANPIFNDTTSVFETSSPRDASVTPDNLPAGYTYPVTDHTGSVSFDAVDTCAQTIQLGAADLGSADSWDTQNPVVPPTTFPSGTAFAGGASITYTPGPPAPPDQVTTPSDCGQTPTASSVNVNAAWPETQWQLQYFQPIREGVGHHITSISCPASNFCAAVDDNGSVMTYDPVNEWTAPQQIDTYSDGPDISGGANVFRAVSCPFSGFCVAMDRIGQLFEYSGGSWSAPHSFVLGPVDQSRALQNSPSVPPLLTLTGLSCASATFCSVVDTDGNTFVYQGALFELLGLPQYPISGNPSLTSVSCAKTTTFCMTVDDQGNAYSTNDGASWSAPTAVTEHKLFAISCPTVLFCAVVDNAGQAATFNGTSWTALIGNGPGGSDQVSLSCPTAQFCYDSDGAYYDGTKWHVDGPPGFSRVSCASYAFCVKIFRDSFGTESNWVSGPPAAPAGAPVDSGDSGHDAVVTLTLGDQYGNPAACQHAVLSPASGTMHPSIVPLAPAHPCPALGTNGPGFSGVDGVAQFRVTDSSAQSVALGFADSTVAAVWSSNASINPSDVAQVNFVDPSFLQIATVDPASPVAGAAQGATVTVHLQDAPGQPDSGHAVTLNVAADSAGQHAVITPSTPTATGADGNATFQVTDPDAETVNLQATDDSGLTSLEQSITFTNGGLSLSPDGGTAAALADGLGQQNITFGLTDTALAPIAGCVLIQASGSATITQPPNDTLCSSNDPAYPTGNPDAQKRYVWTQTRHVTITDTSAEKVTVTATAVDFQRPGAQPFPPCNPPFQAKFYPDVNLTYCVVIANTAVTFVPVPTTLAITPTAGTIPGDGFTQLPVTVTATNAAGPIAGVPVYLCPGVAATTFPNQAACQNPADQSLQIDPGGGATAAGQPQEQITNANGQATFAVSGFNAGSTYPVKNVTPRYSSDLTNSDAQPLVCLAPCGVTNVTLTPTEGGSSSVAVAPPGTVPADGNSAAVVTVTLQIGSGPQSQLGGHVVVLRSGRQTTTVKPMDVNGSLTKSDGTVRFAVTDTTPETDTYSALDASTGALIAATASSVFSKPEALASTVTVDHASVPVGSPTAPSRITASIKLRNASGGLIVGAPTTLVATKPDGTTSATVSVQATNAVTNAQGIAIYVITDSAAEAVILKAADVTVAAAPIVIAQQLSVAFDPDVFSRSIVRASPVTVAAGISASTLTVDLRDANFLPVRGWTVSVPNPSLATIVPLTTNVSDANGQVKFSVSDKHAEYFCATAGAANCLQVNVTQPHGTPQLLVQQGAIDFTPSEASESTATVTPATLPVNQTATAKITLRDGLDQPIAGRAVTLSGCGSTLACTLLTPGGKTTAAGVIKFAITSTAVRTVVVTITDPTTGVTLAAQLNLTFTAAAPNSTEAARSTVAVSPATQATNLSSTISIVLRDGNGNPLKGHAVSLDTCGAPLHHTRLSAGGKTSATGLIEFSVTSTAPATCAISVTDTTTAVKLKAKPTVTFVNG